MKLVTSGSVSYQLLKNMAVSGNTSQYLFVIDYKNIRYTTVYTPSLFIYEPKWIVGDPVDVSINKNS